MGNFLLLAVLSVLLLLIVGLFVTLLRLKKEQAFVANARQKLDTHIETNRNFASLSPEDDDNLGIIPDKATLGRT